MTLIDGYALYQDYQLMCDKILCTQCPFLDIEEGCKVENLIINATEIDAEPIKYGHWIRTDNGWKCSACGDTVVFYAREDGHYCPLCGAKMIEMIENDYHEPQKPSNDRK